MKLHQSTTAILSTTEGGLDNLGEYYIPRVKAIFVVSLPAIKKAEHMWGQSCPKTRYVFDSYAPEKSRMDVAAVLWREERFKKRQKKITKLPSLLTYLVYFLKQTISCCEFAYFAEG